MRALVLSGGGAGGAFQIGVLKYLEELGYYFDAVYGTSVGALNGAGLKWLGIDGLEQEWLKITDRSQVMKTNWWFYLGFGNALYDTKPLFKMVDDVIEKHPFDPVMNCYACAVNIRTGEVEFTESRSAGFRSALLASSSVPLYMPPVGEMVDGGVREHTPLRKAIHDGHKDVIVIACNEIADESRLGKIPMPKWPFKGVKLGLRATDWLQREVFLDDILTRGYDAKIKIVGPKERIIDTFEFDPEKIRLAIAQGYEMARQQFP